MQPARRHDLDALRAVTMLLGIVMHAGLSFTPFPWVVQDCQQSDWLGLGYTVIHGFRMPLFFMLSGFFTAMLWRRRGLTSVLIQRFKRIFVPILVGCVTIVPAMFAISAYVESNNRAAESDDTSTPWRAVIAGDADALRRFMFAPNFDVDAYGDGNSTLIATAAFLGHDDIVQTLIGHGADINRKNADGGSPLHGAAFLGRAAAVKMLIDAGADIHALDRQQATPLQSAQVDWSTTQFMINIFKVNVEREEVEAGRKQVIELLIEAAGADGGEMLRASATHTQDPIAQLATGL